jgi:hypothetical protein
MNLLKHVWGGDHQVLVDMFSYRIFSCDVHVSRYDNGVPTQDTQMLYMNSHNRQGHVETRALSIRRGILYL